MEHHLTYTPSYTFLSRAAWRNWRNKLLAPYCVWIATPLVALLMCLGSPDIPLSGTGGVLVGILGGVVLTLVTLLLYSFSRTQQSIAKGSTLWSRRELSYTFDEEGVYYTSYLSSARYSWKLVKEAHLAQDALRLFSEDDLLLSLPREVTPNELQKFILTKVQEAGGQLT